MANTSRAALRPVTGDSSGGAAEGLMWRPYPEPSTNCQQRPAGTRASRPDERAGEGHTHQRRSRRGRVVPRIEQALTEAEEDAATVIVDLRRLRFIDSAGLRCLLQAGTRAHRGGHRLSARRRPLVAA